MVWTKSLPEKGTGMNCTLRKITAVVAVAVAAGLNSAAEVAVQNSVAEVAVQNNVAEVAVVVALIVAVPAVPAVVASGVPSCMLWKLNVALMRLFC